MSAVQFAHGYFLPSCCLVVISSWLSCDDTKIAPPAGTGLPESDMAALKDAGAVPNAKFGRGNTQSTERTAA